ncbi:hypothetical protein O4H53_23740 [Sulfitobacter sp. G21635-S1]|uniref:hypothetical protein n=1 Tax=Sulfitobacter sp. G21635-S1 TaxID=3014043 RepID=UPI0022AF8B8C|nr:hypothetical protein [Sulfitobacter sp. G21635-S1]MCZ4258567.1 hypothetical protein [Sulfitobacter sp. G21635-S1]
MADRKARAHAAMVAICASMVVDYLDQQDAKMWADALRDILPDCEGCPKTLEPLRIAATGFAHGAGDNRELSLSRLRFAVRNYYRMQAGQRLEAWRDGAGDVT